MKTRIVVISKERYKKRTIAIAKGEGVPKKDEPKIWFESLDAMRRLLHVKITQSKRVDCREKS